MSFFAILSSAVLVAAGVVRLAAPGPIAGTITHQYPVHYDGPLLSHARFGAVPRSKGGRLPSFDVTYHGGPVEKSPVAYAIYWFPSTSPPTAYLGLVDGFLQAVGGSTYDAVAASYSSQSAPIENAFSVEEADVDTDPFPPQLTVPAIETELKKLVKDKEIPGNAGNPVFVFLPQGAPFTVQSPNVCALHSAFDFKSGGAKATVVFAVVPYQGGNAACEAYRGAFTVPHPSVPGGDAAIANASRELLEIVTDPFGNAWYDDTYGEIGDICFFDYGDQDILGEGANIDLNGNLYQVPAAFEQSVSACKPNLGGGPSQHAPAAPAFAPTPAPTPGMTFHGGPIQPGVTTYAIFWGSAKFTQTFEKNVEQFESDLNGGVYYADLTQYTGSNGQVQNSVIYGGAYLDKANPPKSVSMKQAGAEVEKALSANPSWSAGLGAQFFVYTPAGVAPSPGFCGAHASLQETLHDKSTYVVYAYIPFAKGSCATPFDLPSPTGDPASDDAIKTMGHEGAEMMTDPLGNAWKGSFKDSEVADLCIGNFGMLGLMTNGANITLNGHAYRVQELWSQQDQRCAPNF